MIRNIITTPYSFPPKHYFSLPCSASIGTGHSEVVLRGLGLGKARDERERRSLARETEPTLRGPGELASSKTKIQGQEW